MKTLSTIFTILSLLAPAARADTHVFDFVLSGAQVNPPVATPASGLAQATLDDVSGLLQMSGSYSGLTGALDFAALHGPAFAGESGAHITNLSDDGGTSGTFNGQTTLSAQEIADVLAGMYYIDLHTDTFGGGEIRGQIVPAIESFCFASPQNCTDCPCNNTPTFGQGGCLNSAARSASLLPSGSPSLANDELRFELRSATGLSFGLLASADNALPNNPSNPCPAGSGILASTLDGLRCVGGNLVRHGVRATDANGDIGTTNAAWGGADAPAIGLIAQGGFGAGQTRHFQVFYRENNALGCGTGQNSSDAASVTFLP